MSATQGTVVVHLRAGLPWRVPPRSLSAIEGKGRRSLPAAAVLCLAALEHHRSRALLVDRGDRSYDRLFRVVALNGNIAGAQKAEYSTRFEAIPSACGKPRMTASFDGIEC